jgi:hypothetical protein
MLTATHCWFDFIIDEGSKPPHFRACEGLAPLILVDRIQQIIQLIHQGTRVESSDGKAPEELSYSLE